MRIIKLKNIKIVLLASFIIFFISLLIMIKSLKSKKSKKATKQSDLVLQPAPEFLTTPPKYLISLSPLTESSYNLVDDGVIITTKDGKKYKVLKDGRIYEVLNDNTEKLVTSQKDKNKVFLSILEAAKNDNAVNDYFSGENEIKNKIKTDKLNKKEREIYSKITGVSIEDEPIILTSKKKSKINDIKNPIKIESETFLQEDNGIESKRKKQDDTNYSSSKKSSIISIAKKNQKSSSNKEKKENKKENKNNFGFNYELGENNQWKYQNNQEGKSDFLEKNNRAIESSYLTDYDLALGTVIPIVMITGINSDLPGKIIGQAKEDIYDSLTNSNILIPKGTRFFATYDSSISFGQNRLLVSWTDLIRPDGLCVTLSSFLGSDSLGRSGYEGNVDNHLFSIFEAASGSALIDIGSSYAKKILSDSDISTSFNALISTSKSTGEKFIDLAMNRQPTITIPPGKEANIIVGNTIRLR